MRYLLIYIAVVSAVAVILTVYDKIAAKKYPHGRIRERTLLAVAAAGGSLAEYITMLIIRHKTRHKKFMAGLPLILAVQLATAVCIWYFLCR